MVLLPVANDLERENKSKKMGSTFKSSYNEADFVSAGMNSEDTF